MQHDIIIYTDGACSGNPGRGGYGLVLVKNGTYHAGAKGGYRLTTNNRMEILAASEGLAWAKSIIDRFTKEDSVTIDVRSDSQLVVSTMNDGWQRKSNIDLWQRLDGIVEELRKGGVRVSFTKVKGHSGDRFNEMADRLAVEAYGDTYLLMEDNGYGKEGTLPGTEKGLFDEPASEEPRIVNICMLHDDKPAERKVEVSLSNGTIVSIVGVYGGFAQSGCTQAEAVVTVEVAHLLTGWLNGGPLPSAR